MSKLLLLSASIAAIAFGGAASAQTNGMMSDQMSKPMHMSKSQMRSMHKCQSMSHDAMMKSGKCMTMMKMHPEMMKQQ